MALDIFGAVQTAGQIGRQQDLAAQTQREDTARQALDTYSQSLQAGTPDNKALQAAFLSSPQIATQGLQGIGIVNQLQGREAANYIMPAVNALRSGNLDLAKRLTQQRIEQITARGGDPSNTQQVLGLLDQDPHLAQNELLTAGAALGGAGQLSGDQLNSLFSQAAPDQIQSTVQIPGLGAQVTTKSGLTYISELDPEEQARVQEFNRKELEGTITKTERTEKAKLDQKENAAIRKEINQNGIQASRSLPKFEELRAALQAQQTGKGAQFVSTFGQFLPGIDPSDEVALNSAMNALVFEELQKFTGALSDSEREFARQTTTNLGNTTAANIQILDRLIRRSNEAIAERKQFQEFTKGGGNPLDFAFQPVEQQAQQEAFTPPSVGQTVNVGGIQIKRVE